MYCTGRNLELRCYTAICKQPSLFITVFTHLPNTLQHASRMTLSMSVPSHLPVLSSHPASSSTWRLMLSRFIPVLFGLGSSPMIPPGYVKIANWKPWPNRNSLLSLPNLPNLPIDNTVTFHSYIYIYKYINI